MDVDLRPFFYTRGARIFAKNDLRVGMDLHISKCRQSSNEQVWPSGYGLEPADEAPRLKPDKGEFVLFARLSCGP